MVKDIINKLKECDDFHNRCDYLLEHDEITYLLEYIEELLDRIDKAIEYTKKLREHYGHELYCTRDLLQILKGEE